MAISSISIRITGKVQGVYFRQSMKEEARRLNLRGFVRNEPDGAVYAEASGSENALEAFLEWCGHGPENAVVEEVSADDLCDIHTESFDIIK